MSLSVNIKSGNMQFNIIQLIVLIMSLVLISGTTGNKEGELLNNLFVNYNTNARPVEDPAKVVLIDVELELRVFRGINDVNGVLSVVGFLEVQWYDEALKWNLTDYPSIPRVAVPASSVWLPDFGLINSAEQFYNPSYKQDYMVDIQHNGYITWKFGGLMHSSCNLDVTHFPFDMQTCFIQIENVVYTEEQVDFNKETMIVEVDDDISDGIWSVNTIGVNYSTNLRQSGARYPRLSFSISVSRKSSYYVRTLMVPCVLITMVTLAMFWLPPDCGEKVSLGITILLGLTVVQLVIDSYMPMTSDYTPRMSLIVIFIMSISSVSLILAITVVFIHTKGSKHRVPRLVKAIFLGRVASILCVHQEPIEQTMMTSIRANQVESNEKGLKTDSDKSDPSGLGNKSISAMTEIESHLAKLCKKMEDKDQEDKISEEWKCLATVIDRLCFCIVLVIVIVTLTSIAIIVATSPDYPNVELASVH